MFTFQWWEVMLYKDIIKLRNSIFKKVCRIWQHTCTKLTVYNDNNECYLRIFINLPDHNWKKWRLYLVITQAHFLVQASLQNQKLFKPFPTFEILWKIAAFQALKKGEMGGRGFTMLSNIMPSSSVKKVKWVLENHENPQDARGNISTM